MTEDELFARRPLGMRMAMVVRQWRAIIDCAITDTGLTQSSWTVLMQLHQLGVQRLGQRTGGGAGH